MKNLVIVKLGGSVVTMKAQEEAIVNQANLERLALEISTAKKEKDFPLLVVHGAGPFGHVPAKKYRLTEGLKGDNQIEGFIKTHHSMEKLNFQVVTKLQKHGLKAISFQPSSSGILENSKLISFSTDLLKEFLSLGMIPVLYGDVLIDRKTRINILSGDHLVPYLAEKLNATLVIFCADVDGIFTADPKRDDSARLISHLSSRNLGEVTELSGSKNTDVTGGMERKVNELLNLADKRNIEIEIINGFQPTLLKRTLVGERGLGTTIKK